MHGREKEVADLLRARDERGIELLLARYGPLMRYVIAPILAADSDREECLSECCMRVWDGISGFDPQRGSWTAWLTTIARNAAVSRARKAAPAAENIDDHAAAPSPEPTPEEALLRKERQAALMAAVGRLSSSERALFYRKYYYLQSSAQIAAELGTSERAVEGRLYRLRAKLRRELGGVLNE